MHLWHLLYLNMYTSVGRVRAATWMKIRRRASSSLWSLLRKWLTISLCISGSSFRDKISRKRYLSSLHKTSSTLHCFLNILSQNAMSWTVFTLKSAFRRLFTHNALFSSAVKIEKGSKPRIAKTTTLYMHVTSYIWALNCGSTGVDMERGCNPIPLG